MNLFASPKKDENIISEDFGVLFLENNVAKFHDIPFFKYIFFFYFVADQEFGELFLDVLKFCNYFSQIEHISFS